MSLSNETLYTQDAFHNRRRSASEESEQKFPTQALKRKGKVRHGRVFSLLCHNLLKVLKLFTAISLSVMMIFQQSCGPLMLPLLIIVAFVMYCDVILYAMVPISFKYFSQPCARNYYTAYKVLKWVLRITFAILGIMYNIFVLSPLNECELGKTDAGILLLATLVAIDICMLLYCCFVSVIVCGIVLTLTASR